MYKQQRCWDPCRTDTNIEKYTYLPNRRSVDTAHSQPRQPLESRRHKLYPVSRFAVRGPDTYMPSDTLIEADCDDMCVLDVWDGSLALPWASGVSSTDVRG